MIPPCHVQSTEPWSALTAIQRKYGHICSGFLIWTTTFWYFVFGKNVQIQSLYPEPVMAIRICSVDSLPGNGSPWLQLLENCMPRMSCQLVWHWHTVCTIIISEATFCWRPRAMLCASRIRLANSEPSTISHWENNTRFLSRFTHHPVHCTVSPFTYSNWLPFHSPFSRLELIAYSVLLKINKHRRNFYSHPILDFLISSTILSI